jgi:hypothetical protein
LSNAACASDTLGARLFHWHNDVGREWAGAMSEWHEIGVAITGMVAKEPPFIQIAIGLTVAFAALMILEGLRANFVPRRTSEPGIRVQPARPAFHSGPRAMAKPPRNPKRHENIVKLHRATKPLIRRNTAKAREKSATPDLPQVASFGD